MCRGSRLGEERTIVNGRLTFSKVLSLRVSPEQQPAQVSYSIGLRAGSGIVQPVTDGVKSRAVSLFVLCIASAMIAFSGLVFAVPASKMPAPKVPVSKIPVSKTSISKTPALKSPRIFTVQPKETLYRFSLRCAQSLARLRQANKLSSDTVFVGQRIRCASKAVIRPAVSFVTGQIAGVKVNIIRINLANPAVRLGVLVPRNGMARGGERLEQMYARSGAIAAINGGYFNTQTYAPVGDVVAKNRLLARGQLRTALGITLAGRAQVLDWNEGNQRTSLRSSNRWRGFATVIGNGPHIVRGGQVSIHVRHEGYRDGAIVQPNPRSAIGLINDREIVLVSTSQEITLEQLARVMLKLRSREALVLDGGSSTAMIWRGKTVIRGVRRIAYGICVFGP
jgi:LysM repeat protein